MRPDVPARSEAALNLSSLSSFEGREGERVGYGFDRFHISFHRVLGK